jgi:transcription initiation factor IIE alpha subunit
MIPTLEELKRDTHTKVNDIRRIDAILNEDDFATTWESLTPDEKLEMVNAVAWANKTAVIELIKKQKSKALDTMNLIQLRLLAKQRGLVAFMQMSKSTLLSELSKTEGLEYE